MIKRFLEKEILNLLKFFPVVGIIGSRQVGKTTLSKMISEEIKKEVIYLDLESFADYNLLNEAEIYFKENSDKCIIIDEIQRRPELFSLMRSIIDSKRENSKFIILGSSSPSILKKSSESLAGRISYVELSPFNYIEVKEVDSLSSLWFKGGYPLSFLSNEEYSKKFIDSLIISYVEKEFSFLGLAVSPVILRNLWNMLAHINGSIINYSNLSKSLGISQKTISNYIDYFEGAFLVRRLRPYFTNIKKRLVKTPKIYIRDTGLLHNLLSINNLEVLFRNPILGNSWEGFVIEQISQILGNKYEIYFYRTQDGSEIDLVISKSNFPVASVEIKFSNAPKITRGYTIALEDISSENNFIIGYGVKEFRTKNNILVTNLENFLTVHIHNL